MSVTPPVKSTSHNDSSHCLVATVAEAMKGEPALEAVKIDHAHRAVSVATLGRADNTSLEKFLTEHIRKISAREGGERCELLEGAPSCDSCRLQNDPRLRGNLSVQNASGVTTISRPTCPTAPRFWRWRELPLPRLVPREVHLPEADTHEDEWKAQLVAAILCGVFGLAGHFLGGNVGLAFFVAAYVAGAWFTVHEIFELLQEGVLDVHFLMLAVAAGSASIGAWAEGATLLFLFSISGALEHYAMGRTHREIRSLFKDAPKTATVLDERGNESVFPVEQLAAGMHLHIKPGEQFPVDVEILKGQTASDESNLTGEAAPVEKRVGDSAFAGTLNLWGAVEAVVLRPASQSALQKIIALIKEAQHLKAPSQRFTDKFGTTYTYGALGLCAVMFFVWWLGFGLPAFHSTDAVKSAFYRAMTLLVVASPCALVLSIPSAVLAAIAWSARRGILFRGGAAVENLSRVSVVALDKTGTLTTGELQVERVESFPPGREEEIARLAFSLERLSAHPLARAITKHGKQQQLTPLKLERFESVTGLGLRAWHEGEQVLLGRREWVTSGRAPSQAASADAGQSEVWIAKGALLGRVLLRDDVRPQARLLMEKLRALGLHTVVLTGDHRAAAKKLQAQLALEDVRSELKPEQKVEAIHSFVKEGRGVAMIGDGVNDAPSLAAADVGVAMGARGSDAALEQAEVVLMHDRLENFLTAFQLSRRARRVIRQNLFISLGTVAVLAVCALFGAIPLTVGVVGHEGSTVVVVMNSLRLLFGRAEKAAG